MRPTLSICERQNGLIYGFMVSGDRSKPVREKRLMAAVREMKAKSLLEDSPSRGFYLFLLETLVESDVGGGGGVRSSVVGGLGGERGAATVVVVVRHWRQQGHRYDGGGNMPLLGSAENKRTVVRNVTMVCNHGCLESGHDIENGSTHRSNPLEPEEFRRQGHMIIDFLAGYYKNVEKYPVCSQVEPGYLLTRLPDSAPLDPEPIERIIEDVENHILQGTTSSTAIDPVGPLCNVAKHYRVLPSAVGDSLKSCDEKLVNEFNRKLLASINETGRVYMTHDVVGRVYLIRFAVGVTLTDYRHVKLLRTTDMLIWHGASSKTAQMPC
ncbi:hypothetical protein Vadar_025669 [Vaccinium darrowii]|uniref:Uncharacterized protein n=1 Tax=Vaccinium darrowii TaxID=229202 RepID=A0ACB7YRN9_9ERIC|nr:hypothetical protein Vadar_025669 [Vaccinium darrowii]